MHGKRKFIRYAWKTSLYLINSRNKGFFSRMYYFADIVSFGFRFNATTKDYLRLKYYEKSRQDRKKDWADLIEQRNFKNRVDRERIVLSKYSLRCFENHRKWHRRNRRYKKYFNMGDNCWVQFNVWISCTHGMVSSCVKFGNNVNISRNVDLDYTGGLEVGSHVKIAEGVKVLTHGHDFFGLRDDVIPDKKNLFLSRLVIKDKVKIGTHAIIMPGVSEIGENSVISAGSVVFKRVPDNVVVAGNPAKIIAKIPMRG